MRELILAAALLAAPESAAEEAAVSQADASQVDTLISYAPPDSWEALKEKDGVDFWRDGARISVDLHGGKDSRYPAPEDYLKGPETKPSRRLKSARVAGIKARVYRRRVPLAPKMRPHDSKLPRPSFAEEEFLLLPAGKRFLVLSFLDKHAGKRESDELRRAWKAFLESVRMKRP